MTAHERQAILGFVRSVIAAEAGGGPDPDTPPLPLLDAPGACFVTLREGSDIRGCIGSAEGILARKISSSSCTYNCPASERPEQRR